MNFEQRKKEEALKKIALVFKWWILTVNSGKSGIKKAYKAIGDIIDNLLSDYKKELEEEYEKKLDDLYTKAETDNPPVTFISSDRDYNEGFYKGRLKSMEEVSVVLFNKDGDSLKKI